MSLTLSAPAISAGTKNPFRIIGPAVINVSGGRTSGHMLHCVLDAYDGKLPENVVVGFCNTGREMPATLDFIHRMESEWSVRIQWLEFRRDAERGKRYTEVVSHNSASRRGEPFRALLEAKGWLLPSSQMRYCTEELKVLTIKRYLKDTLGWSKWLNVVGLRADEPKRLEKREADNARRKNPWVSVMPLAEAGITKTNVLKFWKQQPFDLMLNEWEGNCDLCFQKRVHQIARMMEDHPDRASDWLEDESISRAKGYNAFYRGNRSLAEIKKAIDTQDRLPFDPPEMEMQPDCERECGA